MKTIDLVYRTMYAELTQRSLDASFESDFPTAGNFVRVPVKGKDYWYFEETQPKKTRKYVGPAEDAEIAKRVQDFREIKDDLRSRRKLVSTLTREAVAREAQCTDGLVSRYFGTMLAFRRTIMRHAIKVDNLPIIAQGLAAGDKCAIKASPDLKARALNTLAG